MFTMASIVTCILFIYFLICIVGAVADEFGSISTVVRVDWGTQVSSPSSCPLPFLKITCDSGGSISLLDFSNDSYCAISSSSEITCNSTKALEYNQAHFTCQDGYLFPQTATARFLSSTSDCLAGQGDDGYWIRNIKLTVLCPEQQGNETSPPLGTCAIPEATQFNGTTCALGYQCGENASCQDDDDDELTIETIETHVTIDDCGQTLPPFPRIPWHMPTMEPSSHYPPSTMPSTIPSQQPSSPPSHYRSTVTDEFGSISPVIRVAWASYDTSPLLSCPLPSIVVTCDNGGPISLLDYSTDSFCTITGLSEVTCRSQKSLPYNNAHFTCGLDHPPATATARFMAATSDCLAGGTEGDWIRLIQFQTLCYEQGSPMNPKGVCVPESLSHPTGKHATCTNYLLCSNGVCPSGNLTLDTIETFVSTDCTGSIAPSTMPSRSPFVRPTSSPTSTPSTMPTASDQSGSEENGTGISRDIMWDVIEFVWMVILAACIWWLIHDMIKNNND